MRYSIHRECWNERTYNGHTDNPYWYIKFENYEIGLNDKGEFWNIQQTHISSYVHIKETLQTIITECKLNITLRMK